MKRGQHGLTLIELMVALAVAITLLAIGVPAFQSIQANSQAAAQANALVTALSLARSEAVGRGGVVAVCAATSATTCVGSAAWAGGWIVFSDPVLDGVPAADEVVKAFGVPRGTPTITPNPSGLAVLRFNPRGEQTAGAAVGFRLKQAGTSANQDRCVRIMPSGHISTIRVTDSDACP